MQVGVLRQKVNKFYEKKIKKKQFGDIGVTILVYYGRETI